MVAEPISSKMMAFFIIPPRFKKSDGYSV